VTPTSFDELADLDGVALPFQAYFPWKDVNNLPENSR